MAYIKVDHSQLIRTAERIDICVENYRRHMKGIDDAVTGLGRKWQGADYDQLKQEWNQIKGNNSASSDMEKAMRSYADFLRFAAGKYKNAQSNAINRANRLP